MKNTKEMEAKYKIDFRYNWKMFWELLKNYKFFTVLTLVLILFFQASYTLESYLFKLLIDGGTNFASGTSTKDVFIVLLMTLLITYGVLVIMKAVLRWVHLHIINIMESRMILDLKTKLFNHLVKLSYNFHTSNKTGSIISRLVRGANAIERISDVFIFNFVPLAFQTVVVAIAIAVFDWKSTVVIIGVVIAFTVYSMYINKKQQWANLVANDAEDEEKAVISDIFTNIESIKYFGKEELIKKKYLGYGKRTKESQLRHWQYFRWLSAGHSFILGVGVLLIVYFPIKELLAGTSTIGTVAFIYAAMGSIIGNLYGFDHGLRGFYRGMADFESLFKYYRVDDDIKEVNGAKKLKIKKGKISFENVSFKYRNRYILKNFSLKVPENKKVALVGPSGSGKSTIIRLLYRLYDVQKGKITIDDININDVKQESLRSELSIVPQECVLFDDTVENNVAFGNPKATKKQIKSAMRFAQLDKIVKNFPEKENTIVGERGVKLSGGEKQRVSIARAIIANKKILVLDEATSSLDSETEYEIQKDLEKLMKGRTSIIIAHRLSTIMRADMIVVLDKGKVVQIGNHNELINKDGMYKKLWDLQKGGYIK